MSGKTTDQRECQDPLTFAGCFFGLDWTVPERLHKRNWKVADRFVWGKKNLGVGSQVLAHSKGLRRRADTFKPTIFSHKEMSDHENDSTIHATVSALCQQLSLYRVLHDDFPDPHTFIEDNTLFYQEGLSENLFIPNPQKPYTSTIYRMVSKRPMLLCQDCQVRRMQQWVQQFHPRGTKYDCPMPLPFNDLRVCAKHLQPGQLLLYPSVRFHIMVPAKVQFLSNPVRIEVTQVISDLTPEEHGAFLKEFLDLQQFLNQARQGSYRCDKCCPTFLHHMFKFRCANRDFWEFHWPRNCLLPEPLRVRNEYGAACAVWEQIHTIENEKKTQFHTAADLIQDQQWTDDENVISADKITAWVEQVMQGYDPDDLPFQPAVKPWYHPSQSTQNKEIRDLVSGEPMSVPIKSQAVKFSNNTGLFDKPVPRLTLADVMVIKPARCKAKAKDKPKPKPKPKPKHQPGQE